MSPGKEHVFVSPMQTLLSFHVPVVLSSSSAIIRLQNWQYIGNIITYIVIADQYGSHLKQELIVSSLNCILVRMMQNSQKSVQTIIEN